MRHWEEGVGGMLALAYVRSQCVSIEEAQDVVDEAAEHLPSYLEPSRENCALLAQALEDALARYRERKYALALEQEREFLDTHWWSD